MQTKKTHCLMSNRDSTKRLTSVIALSCAIALSLVGCSSPAAPEETVADFTSVTNESAESSLVRELSREVNPDPIVEPLPCSPFLVVTARGTGEPANKQLLSPVVRSIVESAPEHMQTVDIDYPADSDVNGGGTLGARTLVDTLNVQAEMCPDQRTVLLGYSQGALIIGDSLDRADQRLVGTEVGELSQTAQDNVIAVVLYGNPRFVADEPFSVGSFRKKIHGILPRVSGSLSYYAERLRDFCAAKDFVCQNTTLELDTDGHVAYYSNGMQQEGADFVIERMRSVVSTVQPQGEGVDQ